MKHKQRFRLGITLAIPGYLLLFVQGLKWLKNNSPRSALLSLLGVAMMVSSIKLVKRKRSA
ncbi:hypothetical protein Q0M94_02380 [Deinococcus radiomollis]|uniref:hypothetical protein n=1 Tax=Deinococcus radiomollis TaxID=468916 RepID=UPI003892507A